MYMKLYLTSIHQMVSIIWTILLINHQINTINKTRESCLSVFIWYIKKKSGPKWCRWNTFFMPHWQTCIIKVRKGVFLIFYEKQLESTHPQKAFMPISVISPVGYFFFANPSNFTTRLCLNMTRHASEELYIILTTLKVLLCWLFFADVLSCLNITIQTVKLQLCIPVQLICLIFCSKYGLSGKDRLFRTHFVWVGLGCQHTGIGHILCTGGSYNTIQHVML